MKATVLQIPDALAKRQLVRKYASASFALQNERSIKPRKNGNGRSLNTETSVFYDVCLLMILSCFYRDALADSLVRNTARTYSIQPEFISSRDVGKTVFARKYAAERNNFLTAAKKHTS